LESNRKRRKRLLDEKEFRERLSSWAATDYTRTAPDVCVSYQPVGQSVGYLSESVVKNLPLKEWWVLCLVRMKQLYPAARITRLMYLPEYSDYMQFYINNYRELAYRKEDEENTASISKPMFGCIETYSHFVAGRRKTYKSELQYNPW